MSPVIFIIPILVIVVILYFVFRNKCSEGAKPYWNETEKKCEACPTDKPNWDSDEKECEACLLPKPKWDSTLKECVACEEGSPWSTEEKACHKKVKEILETVEEVVEPEVVEVQSQAAVGWSGLEGASIVEYGDGYECADNTVPIIFQLDACNVDTQDAYHPASVEFKACGQDSKRTIRDLGPWENVWRRELTKYIPDGKSEPTDLIDEQDKFTILKGRKGKKGGSITLKGDEDGWTMARDFFGKDQFGVIKKDNNYYAVRVKDENTVNPDGWGVSQYIKGCRAVE